MLGWLVWYGPSLSENVGLVGRLVGMVLGLA